MKSRPKCISVTFYNTILSSWSYATLGMGGKTFILFHFHATSTSFYIFLDLMYFQSSCFSTNCFTGYAYIMAIFYLAL